MNTLAARLWIAFVALLVFVARANAHGDHTNKVYVNGAELSYIEGGSGPAVILLHGGLGDWSSWQPQMMALGRQHRVIAYSRRYAFPNNNPPTPPDYSLLTDVNDLAGLIEKLGLRDVRLVGHSAGGFIALAFALKYPESVHSLVLSEPPVHQLIRNTAEGEAAYQDFMSTIWIPASKYFRQQDAFNAMKIFVNGMAGAETFEGLTPPLRADLMRDARTMEAHTLSTDPFPILSPASLKRLSAPTLVVTGANTIRIHKLVNAELARLIPDCKTVTIPNAGHDSPRENIPAFNQAVVAFLSSTD